jgi:hypothetical protein
MMCGIFIRSQIANKSATMSSDCSAASCKWEWYLQSCAFFNFFYNLMKGSLLICWNLMVCFDEHLQKHQMHQVQEPWRHQYHGEFLHKQTRVLGHPQPSQPAVNHFKIRRFQIFYTRNFDWVSRSDLDSVTMSNQLAKLL